MNSNNIETNEERVIGKEVTLDEKDVKNFFDDRKNKKLPYRYNYVNYQDNHPEKVLVRDKIEKERITKYLSVNANDHVLDIGCGVGRWGDYIVPRLENGRYVGVDYTQYFIDLARQDFENDERATFINGRFQELSSCLKQNGEFREYNRILINGVLMYINDADLCVSFEEVEKLAGPECIIYLRESVGVKKRLTLNKFYSEELGARYSVIYRSISEYSSIISKYLLSKGFFILACGPTWNDGIDYSCETDNWYWIIQRA